jgi:UDP-N-acetyl-2-amino-2-deoxyglucuronate dehydrogenase
LLFMKKKLHFAIVGSGAIAQVHIQCIQELADAELIAICGRDEQKMLDRIDGNKSIKIYTDYHEMLADDDVDVVVILTPSATHADFGKAAAQAGKHIIMEKPIDINMAKTDELIEQCKNAGVKLCCIFQHRFDDAVCELKEALDDGELGPLNFGASHTKWYRSQEYYDEAVWRGSWSLGGGGALMNQSIHSLY